MCISGLVQYPGGIQKLVVTAGFSYGTAAQLVSTEIFNLNTYQWEVTLGPNLPRQVEKGVSVPFQNTFLVVGGYDSPTYLTTIYQYDPNTEDWITRDETILPREVFTAFLIPDDIVTCS